MGIKFLMEKYNLPEQVARKVGDEMGRIWLIDNMPSYKASKSKPDNMNSVDIIRRTKEVIMPNPQDMDASAIRLSPQITEVQFIINGLPNNQTKRVYINDPFIIGRIRQCLEDDSLRITPKRKRGGQPKSINTILKNVFRELMTYCPTDYLPQRTKDDADYSKRVFAAHVVGHYLPDYRNPFDSVLQNMVKNIINPPRNPQK